MKFAFCSTSFIVLCIFQLANVGNSYTEPCRMIRSVHESVLSTEINSQYGGHIWQHIDGLKEKPSRAYSDQTQSDKSLFLSEHDFRNAWNNWRLLPSSVHVPEDCDSNASPGTKVVDCVDAAKIKIVRARRCIRSSQESKLCIQRRQIWPQSVYFVYKKSKSSYRWKSYWYLLTAYPAASSCN